VTPRYAGLVSRALALMIDIVFLAALVAGTVWFFEQVARQVVGGRVLESGQCPVTWWGLRGYVCRAFPWVAPIAAISFPPLYRIGFWTITAQTPGMALLGLRIRRVDGAPMNVWTSVRRLVGYAASVLSFGGGFLLVLFSSRRRALHDFIAGTVVVHEWIPPAKHP
jgi:uncharacterized RDD family membrane protein YckC